MSNKKPVRCREGRQIKVERNPPNGLILGRQSRLTASFEEQEQAEGIQTKNSARANEITAKQAKFELGKHASGHATTVKPAIEGRSLGESKIQDRIDNGSSR